MIFGTNKTLVYQGLGFHIQIEDLPEIHSLDSRIYISGQILLQKRIPYQHLLQEGMSLQEQEKVVQGFLSKNITILEQGILQGRLDGKIQEKLQGSSGAGE